MTNSSPPRAGTPTVIGFPPCTAEPPCCFLRSNAAAIQWPLMTHRVLWPTKGQFA
jgi:hypothetical protein